MEAVEPLVRLIQLPIHESKERSGDGKGRVWVMGMTSGCKRSMSTADARGDTRISSPPVRDVDQGRDCPLEVAAVQVGVALPVGIDYQRHFETRIAADGGWMHGGVTLHSRLR